MKVYDWPILFSLAFRDPGSVVVMAESKEKAVDLAVKTYARKLRNWSVNSGHLKYKLGMTSAKEWVQEHVDSLRKELEKNQPTIYEQPVAFVISGAGFDE